MEKFINVPFKIESEFVDDVLCTAFYDGIGYWSNHIKCEDLKGKEYKSEVPGAGGTISIVTDEDPHGDGVTEFEIDFDKFCIGFERYIEFAKTHNREYFLDAGNIDSIEADIIVQLTIFGEVIYG